MKQWQTHQQRFLLDEMRSHSHIHDDHSRFYPEPILRKTVGYRGVVRKSGKPVRVGVGDALHDQATCLRDSAPDICPQTLSCLSRFCSLFGGDPLWESDFGCCESGILFSIHRIMPYPSIRWKQSKRNDWTLSSFRMEDWTLNKILVVSSEQRSRFFVLPSKNR